MIMEMNKAYLWDYYQGITIKFIFSLLKHVTFSHIIVEYKYNYCDKSLIYSFSLLGINQYSRLFTNYNETSNFDEAQWTGPNTYSCRAVALYPVSILYSFTFQTQSLVEFQTNTTATPSTASSMATADTVDSTQSLLKQVRLVLLNFDLAVVDDDAFDSFVWVFGICADLIGIVHIADKEPRGFNSGALCTLFLSCTHSTFSLISRLFQILINYLILFSF